MSPRQFLQSMTSLRFVVLAALLCQNVSSTIFRRYLFGVLQSEASKTELLFVTEVLKGCICGWFTAFKNDPDEQADDSGQTGWAKIVWLIHPANSWQMSALAFLYGIMNISGFVALANLSAVTFTVLAQLKMLVTAVFSVLILRRFVSQTKWRALVLLVCGCLLVSAPSGTSGQTPTREAGAAGKMIGLVAVAVDVIGSGFASIYFEKVIKTKQVKVSIWARNVQLAFWSMVILSGFLVWEQMSPSAHPLGHDWSLVCGVVVFLMAAGGILVALSVKLADSIAKTIAIAGAVALSSVFDYLFLGGRMNREMAIGVVVTVVSTLNYSFDTTVEPASPAEDATAGELEEIATLIESEGSNTPNSLASGKKRSTMKP